MAQTGYRMEHTMLKVKNLGKTMDFYTRLFGMRELRRAEYPGGKFTNTFVGYDDEEEGSVLELTYNWDRVKTMTSAMAGAIWRSRSPIFSPLAKRGETTASASLAHLAP